MFGKRKDKNAVRKNKITNRSIRVDIGRTIIELTFDDKSKFKTVIYGEADQYVHYGHDARDGADSLVREPVISKIEINQSSNRAQYYLKNLNEHNRTYVNNEKGISEVRLGKVIKAKILTTMSFFEDFNEAIIVPNDGVHNGGR